MAPAESVLRAGSVTPVEPVTRVEPATGVEPVTRVEPATRVRSPAARGPTGPVRERRVPAPSPGRGPPVRPPSPRAPPRPRPRPLTSRGASPGAAPGGRTHWRSSSRGPGRSAGTARAGGPRPATDGLGTVRGSASVPSRNPWGSHPTRGIPLLIGPRRPEAGGGGDVSAGGLGVAGWGSGLRAGCSQSSSAPPDGFKTTSGARSIRCLQHGGPCAPVR